VREDRLRIVTAIAFCSLGTLVCLVHAVLEPSTRPFVGAVGTTTALLALVLWRMPERWPDWAYDLLVFAGVVVMTANALAEGRSVESAVYYVWPALWSAYFLPPWRAALQAVVIAVAFAISAAAVRDGGGALLLWVDVVLVVGLTAVAFSAVRARTDDLLEQVHRLATTDDLTGLLNRRGLAQRVPVEVERLRRTGGTAAVVALDLDHFKALNDVLGHEAGDEALRVVGGVLSEASRTVDVVARTGGEEFVALLPGAGVGGAVAFADRVRATVTARCAVLGRPVTISAGVALLAPGQDPQEALRAADTALYRAKAQGRDRTAVTEAVAGQA